MSLADHLPAGFVMPDGPSDRVAFWQALWTAGVTPWDLGGPHPELVRRVGDLGPGGRAFVPGCGRGHDARFLADSGWNVLAVDGVATAVAAARAAMASCAVEVKSADAFTVLTDAEHGSFDLVWEHTFLCALPPERGADWARLVDRALRPGGLLGALVFPVGKPAEDGGPPFGIDTGRVGALLGAGFDLVDDAPAVESPRRGNEASPERFAIFKKAQRRGDDQSAGRRKRRT